MIKQTHTTRHAGWSDYMLSLVPHPLPKKEKQVGKACEMYETGAIVLRWYIVYDLNIRTELPHAFKMAQVLCDKIALCFSVAAV